jgi:hypothetical protein
MVPVQHLCNETAAFDMFTLAKHNSWKFNFDNYMI